jgi:CDGSH-type Zn-finger protein
MLDYGFGRSDGHHKAVDFSSEKIVPAKDQQLKKD